MIRTTFWALILLPLALFGQTTDSLFSAARAHYFSGSELQGQEELKMVLQQNPDYLEARHFLVRTYLWQNKPADAKTNLRPIRQLNDSTTLFLFVETFILEREQDSAWFMVNRLDSLHPRSPRIKSYLAQIAGLGTNFFRSYKKLGSQLREHQVPQPLIDEAFLAGNWWYAGADYLFDNFSHQPAFPRNQVAVKLGYHHAKMGNYQMRLSRAQRFGLDDSQLELEAYPRFGKKWYALVHAGLSGGTLFPTSRWGIEPAAALLPNSEISAGIRALHFQDFSIYLATLAANYSTGNSLWGVRWFGGNSSRTGHTAELMYRYSYRTNLSWIEARITYGTSPANEFLDQSLAGLLNNSSAACLIAWEHSWGYRWASRLQAQYNYQDPHPLPSFHVTSLSASLLYRFQ